MKNYKTVAAIAALVGMCLTSQAGNVALGKPVTGNGTFGVGGWGLGVLAPVSTVTDGIEFPASTQWDQNTVWWDERYQGSMGNSLEIALGGTCWITGFSVQADDNDSYLLEYWDGAAWQSAWAIPAVGGWGMQTRTTTLGAPIVTSGLRFTATGGDLYYSVSEIAAEGRCVPDAGATLPLLMAVFGGFCALRRRVRA